MVAAVQDEVSNVFYDEARKRNPGQAVGGGVPLIEELIPDDETHAVAKVEKLDRRRIVTGPDRIDPHVLHALELSLSGSAVEGRPQRTLVVVQVDAFQLDPTSIQVETVGGGAAEGPDPEGSSPDLDRIAGGAELDLAGIQVGSC